MLGHPSPDFNKGDFGGCLAQAALAEVEPQSEVLMPLTSLHFQLLLCKPHMLTAQCFRALLREAHNTGVLGVLCGVAREQPRSQQERRPSPPTPTLLLGMR